MFFRTNNLFGGRTLVVWPLFFILLSAILISCNKDLQDVYKLAGSNRVELEAVLKHYRGDKQKLQAAKFLIANMADKGEIRYHHNGHKEIIPDVETITADFLIENIDLAFDVWRRYPWCSDLSFEAFCEQILPYRMRNEPLENWRRFYYDKYKHVADSLAENYTNKKDLVLFFNRTYRKYYRPEFESIIGDISYKIMEQNRGGSCIQLVLNAVQEMRAFGFPLNIDIIPCHGKMNNAHAYNSFINENGQCIGFSPYSPDLTGNGMTAHVVNRIFYKQPRYRKVTEQYYAVSDLLLKEGNIVLATYNDGRFQIILKPEQTDRNKSTFERLTRGLLYFPTKPDGTPANTPPFILGEDGAPFFCESKDNNRLVTLNDIGLFSYRIRVNVEEGLYVLFGWDNGWKDIAHTRYENDRGLNFGEVPDYGLFLVIGGEERGHKQRPFILVDGKPEYY